MCCKKIMNIFAIDSDPVIAAIHLHDRHVVKMIVESAQMLSTTQRIFNNTNSLLYQSCFINHPCTVWVRTSRENYNWLYNHFVSLLNEYTYRYNKIHKCQELKEILRSPPYQLKDKGLTKFALAMPSIYVEENTIYSYRAYYLNEKIKNNFWTKRKNKLDIWLRIHLTENQFKD